MTTDREAQDYNKHYDEAYFEDGAARGTVYKNYREESRRNRTYFEVAEAIVTCFKPRRVLEIGCATGIVVKHLNDLGVEAHGIDVSEWAVENREHQNVRLCGAESLPFEDDYFDVVFSVHSLEYLPSEIKDAAFSEMTRVCKTGIQFHMLPIIGSGPYVGDTFGHLLRLRTDPSHNLLFDKQWWFNEWAKYGWQKTGLQIAFLHDSEHFELTACQYILSQGNPDSDLVERIIQRDIDVAYGLNQTIYGKPPPGLDVHIEALCNKIRGPQGSTEVERLKSDINRLNRELATAQEEVNRCREDARKDRRSYTEILESTSWRLTKPLRSLVGRFKH
ncbi:hypothetical protein C9I56_02755 [Paraburkholderia caribensis]|uniref:class I SAM-dependent methyltransferase n=1 Tax=Paraburkholderia caribensis TaxID=75105 RepID=UPI000D16000B|nr:class I SAM-dependent methyltransferase [Paraburkholderia caribensis]PTB30302.1 hypothetical protein C9I56_02755 [Paraburkholderia caribensis]